MTQTLDSENLWELTSSQLISFASEGPHKLSLACRHLQDLYSALNMDVMSEVYAMTVDSLSSSPSSLAQALDYEDHTLSVAMKTFRMELLGLLVFPQDWPTFVDDHQELQFLIFGHLNLTDLCAISCVSKPMYLDVAEYQIQNLNRLGCPFNLNFGTVLPLLRKYDAAIIGSFALLAILPAEDGFKVNNIDFVVSDVNVYTFAQEVGNTLSLKPIHNVHPAFSSEHPITHRFSFTSTGPTGRHYFNFFCVSSASNIAPLQAVFYASSTLTMNAIVGSGIFCAYRYMTPHGRGLRAYSHNLPIIQLGSGDTIRAQIDYDNVIQSRFEGRDLTFIPSAESHILDFPYHRCTYSTSCYDTVRTTCDKGCAFLNLLLLDERRNLGACLTTNSSTPFPTSSGIYNLIHWRLAEPTSNVAYHQHEPSFVTSYQ
ncbi:hypothetical protein CPB83DRAFT_900780 [Crepidotus variabilis]|uniref:F-box domain-containing protein n=1 Tax=Crepidotus variabilis TaxID=179855 RepID=A0A9P6E2N1_9AGAR|nr:hypothetical protein CPB83DRAFT_900780 [Crepidotus variabilis]